MKRRLFPASFWAGSLLALTTHAQVVINEVFYHAPGDQAELQWVELYNSGTEAVDLKGWSLAKGIKLHFPAGARMKPGGFLVAARNAGVFQRAYGKVPDAVFEKTIKPKGERIDLKNPAGEVVDSLKFGDRSPWPSEPDGHSASLERICPDAPANGPDNWAASALTPGGANPGGTPGAINGSFQKSLPPTIRDLQSVPGAIAPGTPVPITARVESTAGIKSVSLFYRVLTAGAETPEKRLPMQPAANGRYSATIPAEATPNFGVLRFRVEAASLTDARRSVPSTQGLRPGVSVLIQTNTTPGKIPVAWILNPSTRQGRSNPNGEWTPEDQLRWSLQTKFQTDADLYSLWAGLALTNPLDAGQLAKLRPIFTNRFEERNQFVREIVAADSLAGREAAVGATVRNFRSNTVTSLRPLLNPAQVKVAVQWQTGPAPRPNGGFDPEMILKSWVNLELQYYIASMAAPLGDAKAAELRTVFLDCLKLRDTLREPAKTAFTDDASRQAFQAKIEKLQQSLQEKTNPLMQGLNLAAAGNFTDEAMVFHQPKRTEVDPAGHGRSALIWLDPKTRETQLYDFIEVVERKAGWKIHLHRDEPFNGMTVLNLIYEFNDRFVLAEPLAFDLYRRAGNAASLVDFVRLQFDQQPLGYHLLCEQPNKAFLRRNHLRDDGNLYKLGWQGQSLTELYEKKTQPQSGYGDLEALIQQLSTTQGPAQWDVIRKQFNVEQVLTYFAINSLLSHWDGFMNNHFAYHDVHGSGKWELYPWDQDKAMGFHDAIAENDVFTTLPLSYGAAGDVPPGWGNRPPPKHFFETIRRPGMEWWRPPGYMSGPLLANPDFRRHYFARIKDLLGGEFSEARMHGAINAMGDRLRDEVRLRAELRGEEPRAALANLDRNLDSLRRFVTGRRTFLLAQKEIQQAPSYDRSLLK